MINMMCVDNMKWMKEISDNFYDIAIVDPPYFDGPNKLGYYGGRLSKTGVFRKTIKKLGNWDVPGWDYYNELKRVSKNQIIWGINYFPFSSDVVGRIIWDKVNGDSSFSDCEIASCSMIESVRLFTYMWNGMMQGKSISEGSIQQGNKQKNEKRIHATQKPVNLYRWVLKKFVKPGYKIIDTHGGSGSICHAAHEFSIENKNIHLDWMEKDPEIYKSSCQWFKNNTDQARLV